MVWGCQSPKVVLPVSPKPSVSLSKSAVLPAGTSSPLLPLRYPPNTYVTNGYDLLASSNLVNWFTYPTNKYVTDGETITVTNEYPRMFFRVRVY